MLQETKRFEFGGFVLDADEKVLLRDGKSVPVPPKMLDLLLVLVENHGRVVEKGALVERLWPGTYVEESNLTFSVSKLRKILDDDSHHPRFIETVSKRGYRFIADTNIANGGPSPTYTQGFRPSERGEVEPLGISDRFSRYRYLLPVAIAALLIAGLFAASWWSRANRPVTLSPLKIERLTYNGKVKAAAISPNGKFAAYIVDSEGRQSIWLKNVATGSDLEVLPPADGIELHGILFSPDGDQIYYVAKDSLYKVPILGGLPTEVLPNFAAGSLFKSIALSPDGKQFVFIRPVSQNESVLVIVDADGSNERQVASGQGKGMFRRSVCWSPDGSRIALVTAGHPSVNIVNVADGTVSPIPSPPWKTVWQVAWRSDGSGLLVEAVEGRSLSSQIWSLSFPDGKAEKITNDFNNYDGITSTAAGDFLATVRVEQSAHIWVASVEDGEPLRQLTHGIEGYDGIYTLNFLAGGDVVYDVTAGEKRDVWVAPSGGSAPRRILENAGSSAATPDGKYIVFQGGEPNDIGLFRYDTGTGEKIRLTTGNDILTAFSPDGKWIVFTRWKADATIWKVGIDGGEAVQLSKQPGYALAPAVSPDSKTVAFYWSKADRAKSPEIAVIPFEGGDVIKTFPVPPKWSHGLAKHTVQWTPDGRSINYAVHRDNASNIWSQPVDGGPAQQVTHFADPQIFNFAYSPDGKKLALSRGTYGRDVVLLMFGNK